MTVSVTCKDTKGSLFVIPSKSAAHRLLISAALADKPTKIICPAASRDIAATARCLSALGADIEEKDGVYNVKPINKRKQAMLDCDESGSTIRFLIPVAAALGGEVKFVGHGALPERPMGPLADTLSENGADISYDGRLPLTVRGGLKSGRFKIAGDISSQFISGLIFALPLLSGDSVIEIMGKTESLPYIEMTLAAVSQFGIKAGFCGNEIYIKGNQSYKSPGTLTVEGDWSNAAFWLSLGAFSDEGITVRGLVSDSIQGDRAICEILSRFGAQVECGDGFVTVRRGSLRATEIDASYVPDLVPVLSVVAAVSEGETVIYNAGRLRIKESDRIKTTAAMINALGGEAYETEDGLRIVGKRELSRGRVDSANDHRIAMSAAVAAAVSQNEVIIDGAEAVQKSYGDFFEKYKLLGAEVEKL
ncbi:MAG: 3-phosphoshikimate 1-carboxyvinyltransferase [Oscillospiraceae bacterium]|nr:3-phosphoshikimate 1-carboxyvinyltransferase [Oscillospiraceae bacterium]